MIANALKYCVSLMVALLVAQSKPLARGATAQDVSVDQIIEAVESNYEAYRDLPGLYVSYTSTYRHLRGARFFGDLTFEIVNARRADNMYVAFHNQQGGLERYTWNAKIGMDNSGNAFQISSFIPTHTLQMQPYVDLLFYPEAWYHYEEQFGPKMLPPGFYYGEDYWLPAALSANRESYRLLPSPQTIEGISCHVLERPGVDKVWFDASRGFSIVRRDFWHAGGNLLRERTRWGDLVQAAEGLWLPRKIEHQIYCRPEDPRDLWNQVAGVRTVVVKELEVKPLPDEQFVLSPEPGATVIDGVRKTFYRKVEPGEDPVREAEAEVRRLTADNTAGAPIYWWLGALILVMIATVGGLACWKRRKHGLPKT